MTTYENIPANGTTKEKKNSFLNLRASRNMDYWILFAVIMLVIYGIFMIASASMGKYDEYTIGHVLFTLVKPVVYAGIGFMAMWWLTAHFDLKWLRSSVFTGAAVFTLVALISCRFFPAINSAYAWIQLPVVGTIQPSEFAKTVSVLIIAAYLGDRKKRVPEVWKLYIVPFAFILLYIFIVVIIQNDTGSGIVIFLISCVCLLLPMNPQMKPLQRFLIFCFYALIAFLVFLLWTPYGEVLLDKMTFLQGYQKWRFTSAIDPFKDEHNYGYQLISGLTAFAGGGMFGRGYGNSLRKYMNFPQAESDYILAILVEELGFAGFAALMVLYGIVIFRLLGYALKMKSEKGKIILVGTAMYFVFHIFLNMGGVTGLIPLTGVPLPMISAGGSSTISVMVAVGLSQAVISRFKRGEIE